MVNVLLAAFTEVCCIGSERFSSKAWLVAMLSLLSVVSSIASKVLKFAMVI
jgi:hypothetical protein